MLAKVNTVQQQKRASSLMAGNVTSGADQGGLFLLSGFGACDGWKGPIVTDSRGILYMYSLDDQVVFVMSKMVR